MRKFNLKFFIKISHLVVLAALLVVGSNFVSALDLDTGNAPGVDLSAQSVLNIVMGLTCWFSRVVALLMVLMIIFYSIQIMISRGDTEKFNSGKTGLQWAIVGAIIILGVYSIVATVANAVGDTQGLYNQYLPINCSQFDP